MSTHLTRLRVRAYIYIILSALADPADRTMYAIIDDAARQVTADQRTTIHHPNRYRFRPVFLLPSLVN